MFQEYFYGNAWLTLPVIALLFFFSFFVVVLIRVFVLRRGSERMDELANLPLRADGTRAAHQESDHG